MSDDPHSFDLRSLTSNRHRLMGPVVPANNDGMSSENKARNLILLSLPPFTPFVTAPTINSEVAIAEIREKWFTNEAELLTLLEGTVDISDDCGLATYTNITLFQACQESTVTLEIEDRCGNPATEVIPVWFDSTPPTIQATVENSVLDSKLDFRF